MIIHSSVSGSGSISTRSPTATGLVDVIPSILKMPRIRAARNSPVSAFTAYQLPVDLYTVPSISGEFSEKGEPQQPFKIDGDRRSQHKWKEFFCVMCEARNLVFRLFQTVDFFINGFQAFIVCRPEIFSPCLVGNLGKQ